MTRGSTSFAATLQQLAGAQKSNRGAPIYSRLVNRPIGRLLAAAAHLAGLTPSMVTALSALCTFTAIAVIALARPSILMGLGVGLLLVLGYALDSADGQVARLRGGGTQAGEWLDHVVDSIKLATIHLAVLISFYRFRGEDESVVVLLIPLAFSIIQNVHFFTFVLTDKMRRANSEHRLASQDAARPSVLRSIAAAPHDYGLLCLAFLVFGVHGLFVVLYAVLMLGSGAYLAAVLVKSYLSIRAL